MKSNYLEEKRYICNVDEYLCRTAMRHLKMKQVVGTGTGLAALPPTLGTELLGNG